MTLTSIPGWEGYYAVCNEDHVWSVARLIVRSDGSTQRFKTRRLKANIGNAGYPQVYLSRPGYCKKVMLVHRAVAVSLIPNPHGKEEVNHIDTNKNNSHPSNLEWVTSKENKHHAVRAGVTYGKACPTYGKSAHNC